MSERDRYQPGVPCWVETVQPDVDATKRFYGALFGWQFAGPAGMPGQASGGYYVARLRGRDVAGVGALPADTTTPPAWTTYVCVADVEEAVARATAAGGALLAGPLDADPAGRLAVLRDPAGAVFGVWQAALRHGAQLVNEPSAWAMSVLRTSDPEGAMAFYGDLFGWRDEPFEAGGGQQVTLWRLPGYVGGEPQQPVARDVVAGMLPLDRAAGEDDAPAHWAVDFWIANARGAARRAPALGGRVVVAPQDTPAFTTAVLADPHGATFSVSTLRLQS